MKKTIFIIISLLFFNAVCAQVNQSSTWVNPYTKIDGTIVGGHHRTNPNSTINDNYSTYPNTNPYTGKQGTIQPIYQSSPTITPYINQNFPTNSYPSYQTTPSYQTIPSYQTVPIYNPPSYPVYQNSSYYR